MLTVLGRGTVAYNADPDRLVHDAAPQLQVPEGSIQAQQLRESIRREIGGH